MEGSVVGQNVVKTESTTPKEHKDLVLCNNNGAEIFNGNSMPPSTQHAEHPSGQSFRMRYAFLAIFMLSSELIGSSFSTGLLVNYLWVLHWHRFIFCYCVYQYIVML